MNPDLERPAAGTPPNPRAMVLAAGLGTRLRPLTLHLAKPAVPFLNRPLLEYTFDLLRQAGIQEFVVNLHHRPKSILDAVENFLAKPEGQAWRPWIFFSDEREILGTAGGIAKVKEFLSAREFVVSNAKIYFEQDLRPVIDFHRRQEALATLVLLKHSGKEPFNPVILDEQGRVSGFALKNHLESFENAYIYTGVQILSPEFLHHIPAGPADTVKDVYPKLLKQGKRVLGYLSEAEWSECSTPRRYLEESVRLLDKRQIPFLAESPVPPRAALRGVVAGKGAEIGRGAELENVILWEGARVGPDARLRNVIICGDIDLPAGTRLSDAVVTPLLDFLPGNPSPESEVLEKHQIWPLK